VTASSGTPTGSVFVGDGTGASCVIAALAGGKGSCVLASTTEGGKKIAASYSGASEWQASAGTKGQHVERAATAATLAASANPVQEGRPVTLTCTVAVKAPGSGVPTGMVTFKEGSKELGKAPLDASGVASITTSKLKDGKHDILAEYGGDANFRNDRSDTLKLDVQALPKVSFSTDAVNVDDSVGSVTLAVKRVGSALGPVSVEFRTTNGSAIAGTDYEATTGTLFWEDGKTAAMSVLIPIIARAGNQPKRKFTVTLYSPTGATLGAPATVTVTVDH